MLQANETKQALEKGRLGYCVLNIWFFSGLWQKDKYFGATGRKSFPVKLPSHGEQRTRTPSSWTIKRRLALCWPAWCLLEKLTCNWYSEAFIGCLLHHKRTSRVGCCSGHRGGPNHTAFGNKEDEQTERPFWPRAHLGALGDTSTPGAFYLLCHVQVAWSAHA